MIEDFPVSVEPVPRLVARELAAVAVGGLLYPFGLGRRVRPTPRRRDQRTVVLVHGYLANRSSLMPLGAYLRLCGVERVLHFDYPSSRGIEPSARALGAFLRKNVRGGRIDLVCHSLGGVVARVYLQELGGARRVDRCVTLGTPHRGTYNAYWVASRVGRELRPDSRLLARIEASRARAERVRFTSIVAGSDNIVVPRVFAGGEDLVHLPDLGHVGMLFSPRVFSVVADRLL
jgi:triacylglycerol esterase/lipase EstA (alpha/beta hydrolase family)